jgi:hypothetical protein
MRRAFIKPGQDRTSCGRDVAYGIILANEGAHIVETIEPHQSGELDLSARLTAQQINVAEAWNMSGFDTGNHVAAYDGFIGSGFFGRRPAVPNTTDHFFPASPKYPDYLR